MNGIAQALAPMLGPLAGAGVGALSAWLVFRAKSKDDKQTLIDQLQEERDRADDRAHEQLGEFSRQMDRMWADKAASRQHVGALVDHIWQRKEPPPPPAPAGYIP